MKTWRHGEEPIERDNLNTFGWGCLAVFMLCCPIWLPLLFVGMLGKLCWDRWFGDDPLAPGGE